MVTIKKSTLWKIAIVAVVLIILVVIWNPFLGSSTGSTTLKGSTFSDTGDAIITDSEGKPYVILFSTTTCPHCTWIKDTFDSLANEDFADKINLQHWELNTGDNTITSEIETEVPTEMWTLFQKYSTGGVPTFVFGGKYIRIGTGYERQNDLNAEMEDFKLVIEKLLE